MESFKMFDKSYIGEEFVDSMRCESGAMASLLNMNFDTTLFRVCNSMHFRDELEFVANTVVFLLAGIVIAGRIYDSSRGATKIIEARDWGYTLLLWVYLTVRS